MQYLLCSKQPDKSAGHLWSLIRLEVCKCAPPLSSLLSESFTGGSVAHSKRIILFLSFFFLATCYRLLVLDGSHET